MNNVRHLFQVATFQSHVPHTGPGEQGYGTGTGETVAAKLHHRLAASSITIWKAGLHVSGKTIGNIRGRLFLARLPKTFEYAGQQPGILAEKIRCQRGSRSSCKPKAAPNWLACHSHLGACVSKTSTGPSPNLQSLGGLTKELILVAIRFFKRFS